MTNAVNVPQLAHSIHPSVQLIEGRAVTSSVEIARVYGKQHKNVLQAIEKILPDLPNSGRLNFQPTTIQVEITGATNASGATRDSKAYHLTRDGFTLLAMGFTGKKALAFKLAYIEAFNYMEAALTQKAAPAQKPLPPPVIPNPPQPSRATEAAFLIGQLQLTLARDLLPALLREIENGNASWRNTRWLLQLSGDDQGTLSIPRLTALPASALLPSV